MRNAHTYFHITVGKSEIAISVCNEKPSDNQVVMPVFLSHKTLKLCRYASFCYLVIC